MRAWMLFGRLPKNWSRDNVRLMQLLVTEEFMRQRRSAEHVRYLLQQVQADQDQGLTLADCARKLGVCEMTIRRWRARYESPVSEEAGRIRELELEVDRLQRALGEVTMEKKMLQDIVKKKW